MRSYETLTLDFVRSVLDYDEHTGKFTWKRQLSSRGTVGSPAGSAVAKGYRRVILAKVAVLEHHLAWFFVHGTFPAEELDHINGIRTDNRIANLRLASNRQNKFNTAFKVGITGVPGVTLTRRKRNPYCVRMRIEGKGKITVGSFPTLELAKAAYQEAARERNKEFYKKEFLG